MSLFRGVSAVRERKIRRKVADELREEIVTELRPIIREQVEDEVQGEMYDKARDDVKAELDAEAPDARQREAFRHFVQETEIDAHAQAAVASGDADRLTSRVRWSRRLFGPLPYMVLLGAAPVLYAVLQYVGALLSVEFIGVAAFLLVAFLMILWTNIMRHSRCEDEARRFYKIASEYRIMAERAKTFRIVHAERLETKSRIDELTAQLRKHKNQLDEKFHPSIASVDVARESVRGRIMAEGPVALRFEDDFDDRLEEAQAEAAQAEAAQAHVEG